MFYFIFYILYFIFYILFCYNKTKMKMKKRTRKNCKNGGSRSSSSSSSDPFEDWKSAHPEIMSAYNDAQSTTGSLSIGVIGTVLTAGLFGFIIYNKVK